MKYIKSKDAIKRVSTTSSSMDDAQILKELRNGNDAVFRDLIKKYESLVSATVIGMIGNCSEAEDIGQEVFVRFYKAQNKFRGESSIGTYLTRIAINLSLNEIKRRKRSSQLFFHSDNKINDIADTNVNPETDENKEMVQRAIRELSPKFRSIIVLRLIDGYSTEETARILKVPVGTVLSRLARAQQKLKELLIPMLELNHG
jgi:RNA polymerase sigma-70 factor (ECF subfamily)